MYATRGLDGSAIMATVRERLIQKILGLDQPQINRLQAFIDSLECGDSSPLSIAAQLPLSTPQPIQGIESGNQYTALQGIEGSIQLPHTGDRSEDESPRFKDWPHAPTHRLSKTGTYFVTGGTLYKHHYFGRPPLLDYLESQLLDSAKQFGWQLEAWAVFSNHYHFVAHATEGCSGLDEMLKSLHGETAVKLNQLDDEPDRQVWFNYWDTRLTFEKSYLARLNYVHQNAVKHNLVRVANQYRWCSAAWFERTARPAQIRTIYSFKTNKVNVRDDFEPTILF